MGWSTQQMGGWKSTRVNVAKVNVPHMLESRTTVSTYPSAVNQPSLIRLMRLVYLKFMTEYCGAKLIYNIIEAVSYRKIY